MAKSNYRVDRNLITITKTKDKIEEINKLKIFSTWAEAKIGLLAALNNDLKTLNRKLNATKALTYSLLFVTLFHLP